MVRPWLLREQIEATTELRDAVGGHVLVARLLAQRGITDPAQARAFLDPAFYTPASPFELPGMAEAEQLLRQAIARGERIRVWGDFDADGQTATAVLYEALRAASAHVDYALPRRDEGHGLHPRTVDEALRDGVSTLITCDTGIGEPDVTARAVAAGLTMIITDHHDLPNPLPPAQAIVNPNMLPETHPLHELAGVGVAYMVARALLEHSAQSDVLENMLDLVSLGLVADLAHQVGDVRYLVQRGVAALRHTSRPGLRALMSAAQIDARHLDEQHIGYQLGPRLNAAGRLADAGLAVRLLLTRDDGEALELADALESLNRDRQGRTEAVQSEAEESLRRDPELARQPAIVLEGENWEPGVLGLIATDLARRYNRPTLLIAHRAGQPSTGSARSVEGIDIHEAIASQRALLTREGGHPMAAGFALGRANLPAFRQGLYTWLSGLGSRRDAVPPLILDAEAPWSEITPDLAHALARLAPFGPRNPRPLLRTGVGTLTRVEDISRQRETAHRRLYLDDDEARPLRFTWFNAGVLPDVGERLDLAFTISVGYWRGEERLQLELVDWHLAAPPEHGSVATLVAGREVVDWRAETDSEPLLARLRSQYGPSVRVWAEGLRRPIAGTETRFELRGQRAGAVAILTPPASPEAVRWVLAEVQPQVLYLLPPEPVTEPSPAEFVEWVAGMLRVALRRHGGRIDALRMAARIGAHQSAVVAALRGLEAAGHTTLSNGPDGLRAYLPSPDTQRVAATNNGEAESEADSVTHRQRSEEQARSALAYLLRETRAYRHAYATEPVAALFPSQ